MKIGIIGASGKAGSRIAEEALYRRHEVTAIVRDRSKITNPALAVLERNLFDLTAEDLKDFDAVVDAFGTAFDPESAKGHQTSMKHLISVMEQLPEVRFLVVGGAASLYTDRSHRKLVLEGIPEQWQAVPANMKAAFETLQTSAVNWTYFSPAATFDPNGPRTGKYRLGGNEVTVNSEGESYLSYADFAAAMLDEIEDGNHIRKRRQGLRFLPRGAHCNLPEKGLLVVGGEISGYSHQISQPLGEEGGYNHPENRFYPGFRGGFPDRGIPEIFRKLSDKIL